MFFLEYLNLVSSGGQLTFTTTNSNVYPHRMTHADAQSSSSSAPAQEPVAGEVVVLQIDPVGSVAHLQDAKATKRMRAIQPKKYMAIIDRVSFLHFKVVESRSGAHLLHVQISPSEPGKTWNICDVRVFSSPHWVTYEDENVDVCYRVTVRLHALSTGTFKSATAHEPEQDSSRLDDNLNDEDFEVTQQDLDAMQRPLSQDDWRRLEEAVDEIDETEDPDLRLPLVLYAPIVAPCTVDVDIEADMGFPEDYLGESDRVIR